MSQDRRTFLRTTGAALSAAAVAGCAADSSAADSPDEAGARLDPALLRSVATMVLPSELGDAGRESAVQGFERWAYAYEAVPELNHGYGTSEIRYGPADPVPAWGAQLQALDIEARKRHGVAFPSLGAGPRRTLLQRHIGGPESNMPSPLRAEHVAVALMAHWFDTPDATDRCYGVRIAPQTCRGIENARQEPEALS